MKPPKFAFQESAVRVGIKMVYQIIAQPDGTAISKCLAHIANKIARPIPIVRLIKLAILRANVQQMYVLLTQTARSQEAVFLLDVCQAFADHALLTPTKLLVVKMDKFARLELQLASLLASASTLNAQSTILVRTILKPATEEFAKILIALRKTS